MEDLRSFDRPSFDDQQTDPHIEAHLPQLQPLQPLQPLQRYQPQHRQIALDESSTPGPRTCIKVSGRVPTTQAERPEAVVAPWHLMP